AFLIGLAGALGKDYKDAAQMSDAIEFACAQIQPNVLKYTSDLNEMQEQLRENRADVAVGWNLLARREGLFDPTGAQDLAFRAMSSGQPAINGYLWVPKSAPHPLLAQLFIEWRLSDDGQLPGEAWDLAKPAWGEYHEGLLGASYENSIPAWLRADYNRYYPSLAEIENLYKPIDWTYYAAHSSEWMEQYKACQQ